MISYMSSYPQGRTKRTFTHNFQVPSHCPVKYLKCWSFLNEKDKQEGDYR